MEFKLLSVTGLQTTPAYFCNLMLTHCAGGDDVRIVVKRTKDGVRWEQEGTWIEDVHVQSVWIDTNNAFWCSAIPVALSRDLVRVDFIFSEDAEGFLRDIVLRELRLSWPEMQITEDEQAAAAKPKQPTPWDDTTGKIDRLRQLRSEAIRDRRRLTWTEACEQAGIDPKTARQHAPELRRDWNNKELREL